MSELTIKHMTYTQINDDTFACHNAITGKTWTVDRMTNPLAYADVCGKFVWQKDKAAGMTYAQHLAACDEVAREHGF